jgi:hypothetical protein
MPVASPFVQYTFVALVAIVAAAFILGLRRARGSALAAALLVTTWLGISAWFAGSGFLQQFDQRPPPFLLFAGMFTAATAVVAFNNIGSTLVSGLDIRWLIGFQAFRLPLEFLLHRLYQEGVTPVQMTYAGRNYDIITGILALAILAWPTKHEPPRWAIWAFNLIGLGLLINIVTIAILSAPTPLRRFWNEPANTFVAYLPFVWLPGFLVQAAWFGHLLVFRWLRQSR